MMGTMAKKFDPGCSLEGADVHWMIEVTSKGTTKSYGGAGDGSGDPLYSDRVTKVLLFHNCPAASGKTDTVLPPESGVRWL